MTTSIPRAGLWRRLAALLYDSFLIASLLFLFAAITTLLNRGPVVPEHPLFYLYQLMLIAVVVVFYGWFWIRSGQTLGMQAWRLQLRRQDGQPLDWMDVLRRCSVGLLSWLPLGLGYLWVLVDRDTLTWHDRLSSTEVVVLPPDQTVKHH